MSFILPTNSLTLDLLQGDKGITAQLAVEIDKKYGAPQIRIAHGKEPPDFVAIFNSMLMIHDVRFRSIFCLKISW